MRDQPNAPDQNSLSRERMRGGWRPENLLWIDGIGGATVGVLTLALVGWLSQWYRMERNLILLIGVANLAYGAYSLSLATRPTRPAPAIVLLVLANFLWGVLCIRWAWLLRSTASPLGLIHLVGEGLYVGGLACVEWRYRRLLAHRSPVEDPPG